MTKEAIQTFSYRISQASRSELVVVLYDMANGYMEDARTAVQRCDTGDFDQLEYTEALRKCGRVIDLLIKGLDFQYEISKQLFAIYLYMKKDMTKCMVHKDATEIKRMMGMIQKLRASFYEVSKTDSSGPLMKNTQQIYSGLTYSAMGGSNETAGNVTANRGFTV